MNAFEYAMQMEQDGRKFYLEQAARMPEKTLARIFEQLAKDEEKHYQIFKALKEGKDTDLTGFKTEILSSTKNIFQEMKDSGKKFDDFATEVKSAWTEAREIEDKSEKFYREQASKAEDKNQVDTWNVIADEEHKHWVAMDHIVRFLDRPNHWLEDAEWSNLESY